MPFKNQQQRKACWAQYYRDLEHNVKPRWNCRQWEAESTHRCKGRTQSGDRCTRNVIGDYYCWQHK